MNAEPGTNPAPGTRSRHPAPGTLNPRASLLRRNRSFRLLWLGQVVSQLGDWFNTVAVYALLLQLTGSATAVAWMMVVQLLPIAVIGPAAGVLVDRVDRVRLMIGADLVRAVAILGLLLVRGPEQVWLAYAVMAVSVTATAFFEPARSATIPSVVDKPDLLTANAIGTATWSAMLAIGASVGGLVTAILGRDAAFVINSLSFVGSALFISRMWPGPRRPASRPTRDAMSQPEGAPVARSHADELERVSSFSELAEGIRYLRRHGAVAALTFVKAGWALAGGAVLLLTVFGERVFPIGQSAAAGIGVLYAARGIGAGVGAVFTRRAFHNDAVRLRRAVGPAYFACGACYVLLGFAPNLWAASATVVGAHVAGAVLWIASSVLLQMAVPDQLRGRVFAAELVTLALMSSVMSYLTAAAFDRLGLTPQTLAKIVGALFAVPGIAWYLLERALRRQALAAAEVKESPGPPAVLE
jgi:MFS family permease